MELRPVWIGKWLSLESHNSAICPGGPDVCPKSLSYSSRGRVSLVVLGSAWMTSWTSLQSKGLSRVFSNTTVQKHQELSNLEVLQSPLEILEMHIPGTNTGDLIRNSYFPVQVHDISRWFWYSARAKNCYRVGLHSLRWKGRKTT